jgi:AraC-like DNA-binding protein
MGFAMIRVPFTRASGFGALFRVVGAEAGPGAARKVQPEAPVNLCECRPMQPVPFHLMNCAFNAAAVQLDDPLLGARIGLMFVLEEFAPFAEYALAAATLGAVIARIQWAQPMHSSAERFDLRIEGDRAIWRLRYNVRNEPSVAQHATRTLMPMLGAVRRYAGRESQRIEINLSEVATHDARRLEQLLGLRVRGRQADYELVFPAAWLGNWTPLPGRPEEFAAHELAPYIGQPLPPSMVSAVKAALSLAEEAPVGGIDTTAQAIGLGRHTLQRALAAEHVSYRDLLRHVRIERASHLLAETDQPIAEIALRAGYSDQANFHRAFVGIMRMTPGQFRSVAEARLVSV